MMILNGVNLIPEHRRIARQRRLRTRRWIAGCSVYGVLLLGACIAVRAACSPDDRKLSADHAETTRLISELTSALKDGRARLAEANTKLHTLQLVTDQPDWSILLTALATAVEDDVVLNGVILEPLQEAPSGSSSEPLKAASKSAGAGAPAQALRWRLDLQGHGQLQPSVSRLIMRLQQTGLFQEIKLLRTNREPFLSGHAVAFQIQCTLSERRSTAP